MSSRKANSNMIKCNGKEYLFIHIPKTAGTAISNRFFNGRQITHRELVYYPRNFWNRSIAVVRNPYDRLISVYNYAKMRKSYWHSDDGSTRYSLHPLYKYCNDHSFKEFVIAVCNDEIDNVLLKPQSSFIITPENKIVTEIIRFESLEDGFSKLFGQEIRFPVVNESTKEHHDFDDEMVSLIKKRYEKDFHYFGPFDVPGRIKTSDNIMTALLRVLLYVVLVTFFYAMNSSLEEEKISYEVINI